MVMIKISLELPRRARPLGRGAEGSLLTKSLVRGVTAGQSLTISSTIWSALGKRRGFCRFDRDIMRDIRHDNSMDARLRLVACGPN